MSTEQCFYEVLELKDKWLRFHSDVSEEICKNYVLNYF